MIKVIISDLGNVLVKNYPQRACRKLTDKCAHNVDEVSWFAPESVHRLMDTGKVSKQYLYRQAVKNLKLKGVSQKKFEDIYGNIFSNNIPVQKLMRKLSKSYVMVLLSNTDAIHFEYIQKHFPIINIFPHQIASYKVGYVKPQKQIFQAALKKAKCKPSECVFVDDKLENVKGARRLGIKAIQYTTTTNLRSELKKLGVIV